MADTHSMKVVPVPQDEPSPPPYTEQQVGPSSGSQPQPAGYNAQPGYPAKGDYPAVQQPYTGQPRYSGPHPFSAQPGYPPQAVQPGPLQHTSTVIVPATQTVILPSGPPRPSTWLGLSIFTFLFCVWPIGLAAIVFSCMVDSSYDGGDYEGARRNSNIAKWLNVAAILSGVGVIAFLIIRFAILVNSVVN